MKTKTNLDKLKETLLYERSDKIVSQVCEAILKDIEDYECTFQQNQVDVFFIRRLLKKGAEGK